MNNNSINSSQKTHGKDNEIIKDIIKSHKLPAAFTTFNFINKIFFISFLFMLIILYLLLNTMNNQIKDSMKNYDIPTIIVQFYC